MSWGQWWSGSSGSQGPWRSWQDWQQWQPQSWGWRQGDDVALEAEGKGHGKRKREEEEEEEEEETEEGGGLPPRVKARPLTWQAQASRAERGQYYKERYGQLPRQGDTSDRGHLLSVPVPFGPAQMGQSFKTFQEYALKEGLKMSIRAMRKAAYRDTIASKEFPNCLTLRGPKGDYGAPLRAIQLLEDMFIMMADNNICDPKLLPAEQVEEASDSEGDEAHTVETTLYGTTTTRLKHASKVVAVVAQAWKQSQEQAGAQPALEVTVVRMPKYANLDKAPHRTRVTKEEQQQRLQYLQKRLDHITALKVQAELAPAGLSADTAGLSAVTEGAAMEGKEEVKQEDEQQEAKEEGSQQVQKEEPVQTGDAPPVSRDQFQSAIRSAEDELHGQKEIVEVEESEADWQEEEIQRDFRWISLAYQRDIALKLAAQCVDRQFWQEGCIILVWA